jgi:hypothetical protein
MKKSFFYTLLLFSFLICIAAGKFATTAKVKGNVSDNTGLVIDQMMVSAWKNKIKVSDTKTDKFGNYEIILPEPGEYDFQVSENNLYYYTQKDSDIIVPAESLTRDVKVTINKQELKHKCTRLVEALRHLEKNPKNVSFKGIAYARFPSSMNEFQLFFSSKVPSENLKKESEKTIRAFFKYKLVSDTAYFSKYALINIGHTEKCEMKALDFLSEGLLEFVAKNPESFFEVISPYSNEQITCILKNFIRRVPKEQSNIIFGKLPAYNGRIYDIYTKICNESKLK